MPKHRGKRGGGGLLLLLAIRQTISQIDQETAHLQTGGYRLPLEGHVSSGVAYFDSY